MSPSPSAKPKNKNKRPISSRKKHWWSWPWFTSKWSKLLLACSLLLVIVIGVILAKAYHDFSILIDRKLSGEVFQNTAQLFSTPLKLTPGLPIPPSAAMNQLKKAGYVESGHGTSRTGEFQFKGQKLTIIPGEDSFHGTGARPVRIEYDGKYVTGIFSVQDEQPIGSYEVEPLLITNLFAKNREKRRLVNYEEIPKVLRDAVLSTEDRRFFDHRGFDPIGLVRAGLVAVGKQRRLQATSTITQQVVRKFWLSPERRVIRKLKEIYMSMILESRLTKEQIFTLYANDVYLGQRGSFSINGFGEGAAAYFNKDLQALTIPEAAFLAGIIQSPNHYNPYRYADRALQRRNLVLRGMLETESINQEQHDLAVRTPLNLAPVTMDVSDAPFFVDAVKDQLLEKYSEENLLSQQYRIYTSIDLELQRAAFQAVQLGMKVVDETLAKKRAVQLKKAGGAPQSPPIPATGQDLAQACLIALDPHTGEIKAFVGGRDYGISQLNHLITAKRQPGSIFKPFVYATALKSALEGTQPLLTPSTLVHDEPTLFEFDDQTYEPNNYGDNFYGPVTMRRALTKSLNVATIKFGQMAGYENIVSLAKASGMNEKLMATPAVCLGAYEVTPLEMSRAFTVFANQGVRVEPIFIQSVRDASGKVIEKTESRFKEVLDPRIAYLMTYLMEGVINHGTGVRARSMGFYQPAAGKTGTSHDGWFAGYTSGLLCIVWVGFDDNRELRLDGASSAVPIWAEFMKKTYVLRPWLSSSPFSPPEGISAVQIDADTGLLATPDCVNTITECFIAGSEPKQSCDPAIHSWIQDLKEKTPQPDKTGANPILPTILGPGEAKPLVPPEKEGGVFKKLLGKIF
jgi:penicillin-binding protein 1B